MTFSARHRADKSASVIILARSVVLQARESEVVASIREHHENALFLPDVPLPDSVAATQDAGQALENADAALLVVPAQAAVDGAIMLLQTPQGRVLRKVKRLNDYQAMLQRYDESCESEIKNDNEIMFVGRCVRLEASLEG